jgi:hypothetical protein
MNTREVTTTWTLSRLSREWVGPITVTADGQAVTDWTYVIVPFGQQPASPEAIDAAPVTLGTGDAIRRGVLVGPGTDQELTPGRYQIWLRFVADPEAPVLVAVGVLVIT